MPMALAGGISATISTSESEFRLSAFGFRLSASDSRLPALGLRLRKYSFLLREAYIYFTVAEW